MKILVLPDIHNKVFQAEQIIDKVNPDKVVFLGDYFDSIGDTLETTQQTAEWLKHSLTNPDRIHLLGNHDLSYVRPGDHRCAGFSESKLFAIDLTRVDLGKLQHYCWVGDWLCTHAGLTNEFFQAYNYKNLTVNDFLDNMIDDNRERLYDVSPYRGGRDAHSGIVWCDYDEFVDIPGLKQIFGHTHADRPRSRMYDNGAERWCIDTWLKYYGLYDTKTDEMVVSKVD